MMELLKRMLNKTPEGAANEIVAVADGRLLPMEQVPDPVFSEKMLGDGVAIDLSGNAVVAPADGVVSMIFPTLHAFGLTMDNGIEILVHIGLDTVALNGRGFKSGIKQGTSVKKGDLIIEVDREFIRSQGLNPMTMMVFTQTGGHLLTFTTEGNAERGRSVVAAF